MSLINRVVFGCGRIRGGFERSHSERVLTAAHDAGIRIFDTAPFYRHSEEILGSLFHNDSNVSFATKYGLDYPQQSAKKIIFTGIKSLARKVIPPTLIKSKIAQRPHRELGQPLVGSFSKSGLLEGIERSKNRLKRHSIDLLLLHEPPLDGIDSSVIDTLNYLKNSSQIGDFGVGTGGIGSLLPKIGKTAQCAFWKINLSMLEDYNQIRLHGFGRGIGISDHNLLKKLLHENEELHVLEKIIEKDQDFSYVLMVIFLIVDDRFSVVYSTLDPSRVNRLKEILSISESALNNKNIHEAAKKILLQFSTT